MDSTQAFHGIINLFLIPFGCCRVPFPLNKAAHWLSLLMRINPLTYGVEALRTLLYPGSPSDFSLTQSLATLVLFSLFMFAIAFVVANRRTTKPVA
jgi:ABC-2 type transport system permease protein